MNGGLGEKSHPARRQALGLQPLQVAVVNEHRVEGDHPRRHRRQQRPGARRPEHVLVGAIRAAIVAGPDVGGHVLCPPHHSHQARAAAGVAAQAEERRGHLGHDGEDFGAACGEPFPRLQGAEVLLRGADHVRAFVLLLALQVGVLEEPELAVAQLPGVVAVAVTPLQDPPRGGADRLGKGLI